MSKSLVLRESSGSLVLTVRLGEELYSIPFEAVDEVLPALPIAHIPQCADFLLGVVFLLDQLIPVLDAATRLGLKNLKPPLEPHIVCLRVGDRLIGLQVDEALELVTIPSTSQRALDEIEVKRGFFAGVVDLNGQVIRMLDPQQLLTNIETAAIANIPQSV